MSQRSAQRIKSTASDVPLNVQRRYRPNARANLGLGAEYSTPPQSGRSTPYSYNANASGSDQENPYAAGPRFMDNLEAQNDEMIEGLGSKIKMLKDVRESWLGVRGVPS